MFDHVQLPRHQWALRRIIAVSFPGDKPLAGNGLFKGVESNSVTASAPANKTRTAQAYADESFVSPDAACGGNPNDLEKVAEYVEAIHAGDSASSNRLSIHCGYFLREG